MIRHFHVIADQFQRLLQFYVRQHLDHYRIVLDRINCKFLQGILLD